VRGRIGRLLEDNDFSIQIDRASIAVMAQSPIRIFGGAAFEFIDIEEMRFLSRY
jgi:hypothetical protein